MCSCVVRGHVFLCLSPPREGYLLSGTNALSQHKNTCPLTTQEHMPSHNTRTHDTHVPEHSLPCRPLRPPSIGVASRASCMHRARDSSFSHTLPHASCWLRGDVSSPKELLQRMP